MIMKAKVQRNGAKGWSSGIAAKDQPGDQG